MTSLSRRTRFTIFTIIYIFSLMLFDFIVFDKYLFLLYLIFFIVLGNLYVLYPGYKKEDALIISFLPTIITSSTVFGLIFFPNLFTIFKYILILVSGGIFYISLLINNLIIAEKKEDSSLPLFRVGLIWLQILLIILTIPFITVIYKLNFPFYVHSLLVFIYLMFSTHIYLHSLLISNKTNPISSREYLLLILEVSYIPFLSSLAVSFINAESFLRATFITSVYMGMVGYLRNYIENSLNKKLIVQYSLIVLFFLFVLYIFKP
jgi:hypothetical protein